MQKGRVLLALALAAPVALWHTRVYAVDLPGGLWRGLVDPPSLLRVAVALAIGVLGSLAIERLPGHVRRPTFWLLLSLAPLVVLVAGGPVLLLAFQGPVLVVVAAAIVGLMAARGGIVDSTLRRLRDAPPAAIFAIAIFFYMALGLRLPGPSGARGDEPHYLLMAQSLVSDGDLDLADDYAGREYAPFYSGTLSPHVSKASPQGQVYSFHGAGLPVLIAPAYALGGYPAVKVFMALLAALASLLMHRLLREDAEADATSLLAWVLFTFAPPMALYSFSLYPETPATVVVLALLLLLRAERVSPRIAVAAGLLAGMLPWLHVKFLPVALVALAFIFVRPGSWRVRVFYLALFAVVAGSLLVYLGAIYGRASVAAGYGNARLLVSRVPRTLLALLLDRQQGLWTTSPAWVLALPGAVEVFRARRSEAIRLTLLAGALVGPSLLYFWWSGDAPPARFLVPALPILAIAVAAASRRMPVAATVLTAVSIGVVGIAAWMPLVLHNRPDGVSQLLWHLSSGVDSGSALPTFFDRSAVPMMIAGSLLAVGALAWRWGSRGLLIGAAAHLLLVGYVFQRPALDRVRTSERLLAHWEPTAWVSLQPPLHPRLLQLSLSAGRRIDSLPPGEYQLTVKTSSTDPAVTSAALRLAAGGATLLRETVPVPGEATFTLRLPAGARHLILAATNAPPRIRLIEDAVLVPVSVFPVARP